jgi:hypothetical protein
MTLRRLIAIALSGLFLLALGTYLAGERTEVAVLKTYDPDQTAHETKMWIVDYGGHQYVRIGRASRAAQGWGARVHANPDVELERGGAAPTPVHATFVDDDATREAVDEAFSEKYGWVDWWFGLVVRKNPQTVRLDPRASASSR